MSNRTTPIEGITGFRKWSACMKYQRIDKPTPNGGDYSEIYYCDADNNLTDVEHATQFHLRECKSDGRLVNEIHGLIHPQPERNPLELMWSKMKAGLHKLKER